jgi:hypothetical protein
MCNPIFINTFVVFVRLYWFEKRFQNVVLEARSLRRAKTRSRTKSEAKADPNGDLGDEENGVGNREIVVLRSPNGAAKGRKIEEGTMFEEGVGDVSERHSQGSDSPDHTSLKDQARPPFHRDITFADELTPTRSPEVRLPEKRSKEHSIEFVQNQRNPKDRGTLRIPGPRDFDAGLVPERIEEGEEPLQKETTNEDDGLQLKREQSHSDPPEQLNQDDHPLKAHITIDAPDHPRGPNAGQSAYNRVPRSADHEGPTAGMHLRNRSRSKTFSSFLTRTATEERDPMPYLSWTPTVGRNSAFIDLTEDQREELGGIEYRSLKLLAIILVCKHLLSSICSASF